MKKILLKARSSLRGITRTRLHEKDAFKDLTKFTEKRLGLQFRRKDSIQKRI